MEHQERLRIDARQCVAGKALGLPGPGPPFDGLDATVVRKAAPGKAVLAGAGVSSAAVGSGTQGEDAAADGDGTAARGGSQTSQFTKVRRALAALRSEAKPPPLASHVRLLGPELWRYPAGVALAAAESKVLAAGERRPRKVRVDSLLAQDSSGGSERWLGSQMECAGTAMPSPRGGFRSGGSGATLTKLGSPSAHSLAPRRPVLPPLLTRDVSAGSRVSFVSSRTMGTVPATVLGGSSDTPSRRTLLRPQASFREVTRSSLELAREFESMERVATDGVQSNVGLVFVSIDDGPDGAWFIRELRRVYAELKAGEKELEFVMVGLDETGDAYLSVLEGMPWLAVPYDAAETRLRLGTRCLQDGLATPCLVVWSADAAAVTDRVSLARLKQMAQIREAAVRPGAVSSGGPLSVQSNGSRRSRLSMPRTPRGVFERINSSSVVR
ncbi:uncharacterized protein AMSG_05159 [Thecamonas trahens ATCC 50062]|uniref:Thioredoxin-like fold domain-containing protein n=1 Tax=Thecamonas trahens ATCC 50062 TaxID=461836 RepID=A0A0L0DA06_THETB|nr:hypothetical protein AMSG_05159 [Thecamonas trahens ATCC 50062]KNC49179.1 hypothetical protein AMSG_05159 [Thecamonas trahens ATCC 50062]|eukprot:XP_013758199.1 hypothetical protein AMSG_05159 [Thecamonas trahens ATCC 50062]